MTFYVFADDIQIHAILEQTNSNNETYNIIKKCLQEVEEWSERNFLKLNNKKTKILNIKTRNSGVTIDRLLILGTNIELDTNVKTLGFIIDENLSFSRQINDVCRKGFYMIRQLWQLSSKIKDQALKIQLVHSCILTRIDYCNSLYNDLPIKEINKLQRFMNAAVRFVFNIHIRKTRMTPFKKKSTFLAGSSKNSF